MNYRFTIWLGDIDDNYNTLTTAIDDFYEWLDKGYDDAVFVDNLTKKEYTINNIDVFKKELVKGLKND